MQQRAHRASRGAGDGRLLAGFAVEADHLPDGELRVVVEGSAPLRDIDVAAVRRGNRAQPVRWLRPGDARGGLGRLVAQAHPGPAVPVDQEDGGGALRRPGLRYEEVLPVRGPARRDHELRPVAGRPVAGHRPRLASVGVRDPQVLDPVAVAQERDLGPVGGENGLALERDVSHDPGGRAPRDRQGVEVAEQLEDDRLSVRRDVEGHPGALGDGEGQGVAGGQRQALVLLLSLRIVLRESAGRPRLEQAREGEQQRQRSESHAHYLRRGLSRRFYGRWNRGPTGRSPHHRVLLHTPPATKKGTALSRLLAGTRVSDLRPPHRSGQPSTGSSATPQASPSWFVSRCALAR